MRQRAFRLLASAIALSCALSLPVVAQTRDGAAEQAYMKSMEKMNQDMKTGMDPDPTKAWAKMMVAHHEGAIEMSRTVLTETKDPMIREMAEKAIRDQTKEQSMLKDWISKHGG